MSCVISLAFLTALSVANVQFASPGSAAEAIAQGHNTDAAFARIKGAGRKGLWALHDVAKRHQGKERGRAFEAIGRFANEEAEWALISELKTTDVDAKAGAIRGLGHLRKPSLYRYITAAANSPEPAMRDAAVAAMTEIGGASIIDALLDGPNPHGREVALRVLEARGHGTQLEKGIQVAMSSSDPVLLYEGVSLMAKSEDSAYSGTLKRLARGGDEKLALHAIDVLVEIRKLNAGYVLADIAADPDVSENVWRRAAEALAKFAEEAFLADVEALATAHPDRKPQLLEQLIGKPSDEALGRAMELLTDRIPARAEIGELILERAGDRAHTVAFKKIEIARAPVRRALVGFLRKHARGKYAAELVQRAHSPRIRERVIALELLSELGETRALAGLADMLKDRDPEIRSTAALSMVDVTDPAIEHALIGAAHDPSPRVRLSALRGLTRWAQHAEADAVATVQAALRDPSDDVRVTAIGLLAVPKDPSLLGALKSRLDEAPPRERAAIATALGGIMHPAAIVMLVDLALDHDTEVQQSAMRALESQ